MIFDLIPLLSQEFGGFTQSPLPSSQSPVQIYEIVEDDEEFRVSLEVPGFKADDLSVTVDDKKLYVSGTRSNNGKGKNKKSSFHQVLAVNSQTTDIEKVTATVEDGMLKITAPKKPRPQPATIKVSTESSDVLEAESSLDASNKYAVTIDVPGIRLSDLSVTLQDKRTEHDESIIEVSGIRNLNINDGRATKKSRFNKLFAVNKKNVDTSQLKATLADGVLTVYAPTKPKPEPRSISVASESHKVDIKEDKDSSFCFYVDVPGIKSADLSLKLTDESIMLIKGSRFLPGSVNRTSFIKTVRIDPDSVDASKISANLSDGVLVITAPRKLKPKPRIVPILADKVAESSDHGNKGSDILAKDNENGNDPIKEKIPVEN